MAKFPELDRFLEMLRGKGHRVTSERLHLFREVYAQHGHIDAEALLRSMKEQGLKISRATLYRNLDLLAEYGFVRKHRLGGNRFLYEHVHPGQRHDHLVCRRCGRVAEFVSPAIDALQREICRAHDFDPEQHTLQIHGVCVECAAAERAGGAGAGRDDVEHGDVEHGDAEHGGTSRAAGEGRSRGEPGRLSHGPYDP